MQFLRPTPPVLFLLTTSAFFVTNAAHALEGKALWEKFIADYKDVATISWDSISEESASSFTLQGLKITAKGKPETHFETVVFQDFKESEEGYIDLGGFDLQKITSKRPGKGTGTINSISGKTLKLPALILTGQFTDELAAKRISFGDLSINGVAFEQPGSVLKINSVNMASADIPLKYDYLATAETAGQVAPALQFATFKLGAMSGTQNSIEWSLESVSIEDASIPTTYLGSAMDWMQLYSSASLQKFAVKLGATELFRLDSLTGHFEKPDAQGTIKTLSKYDGMVVNLKAIPHAQTNLIASQLGYDIVESSMTGSGSYNPSSGRMSVEDLKVDIKEMAQITMKYALTGYTEKVANDLQKMQLDMAAGKPAPLAIEPYKESLSKVALENFDFTLTDNSLTGKLLDFQGQQMGMSGDQLAQGAPMFVGMGMAGLKMPVFTEMVTKAVGDFLQNKGSLTVKTQLQEPISIMDMVIVSQGDPKKIVESLKLDISGQ